MQKRRRRNSKSNGNGKSNEKVAVHVVVDPEVREDFNAMCIAFGLTQHDGFVAMVKRDKEGLGHIVREAIIEKQDQLTALKALL